MISLEKWLILTPLQKLSKTVGDLSKLIVAKGFKKSPKVQKIAKSGHTELDDQEESKPKRYFRFRIIYLHWPIGTKTIVKQ